MGYANNEDLPDWLKDLGSSSLPSKPEPSAPAGGARESVPDWMATPPQPPAQPASIFGEDDDEEDVPDWLAGIRTAEGRAPDEPPPPATAPPLPAEEKDNGDWLETIRVRESGSLPAEDLPADDGDFMSRIKAMQSENNSGEEEDASQDWLAGLPNSQAENPSADLFGSDAPEQPDWLSGLKDDAPPPPEDKPDWLQDVGSGIGMGFASDNAAPSPAWLDEGAPAADDEPLWPAEDAGKAAQAVSAEFPGLPAEPAAPSWLADVETGDSSSSAFAGSEYEEAASEVFKLDSGELPDWLAQISPEDALPAPAEPKADVAPSPFDTGELAPADLPSWLQAMRPVGPAGLENIPEAERGEEERIGPLAGLAGVLPAEPEIVQFGRPPSAAVGLQLSEAQRGFAMQLAQMVAAESQARGARRVSLAIPQRAARLAVAILLLLVVGVPMFALVNFSSLPQRPGELPPPEIFAVLNIVNSLQPGDTVLVAVDYQPALAGEVEAAAMGVVDHMIIRGARLVLMSTLPTGPGQIQHFMAGTQLLNHPAYLLNSSYYNLGYLSGGSAGLLQLATDPRTALPVYLDGQRNVWDDPGMNELRHLRDFAAVVVLTDDADLARAWVEQVQTVLVDASSGQTAPLLVVSSAQAEPLLYPYLNNEPPQIQGLVAGLRGAAYYEANIRELNARRYWDAYGAGLSLGVATIVVGAVLGLSRNVLGGRSQKGRGGRK